MNAPTAAPQVDVSTLLDAYLDEAAETKRFFEFKLNTVASAQALLALAPEQQAECVAQTLQRKRALDPRAQWQALRASELLLTALLRKSLPYNEAQAVALCSSLIVERAYPGPDKAIVGAIERLAQSGPLPPQAISELEKAHKCYHGYMTSDGRRTTDRIAALLRTAPELPLVAGEPWSDQARADIESTSPDVQLQWIALLDHCRAAATVAAPSAKWLKEAAKQIDAVGRDPFTARLLEWFPLVEKPGSCPPGISLDGSNTTLLMLQPNVDLLKGLVFCASLLNDQPEIARALGKLGVTAYKKVPGVGPRAVKLGNACVYALGALSSMDALGQLALMKVKVKFGMAQKGIDKALTNAAEQLELPREEIEEIAVPTYGLEEVGRRVEPFGDFQAELLVAENGSTELRWIKPDGKLQKSVPAAVTQEHADDLKELKAAAKDIQQMLPAQRERIDGLFLAQKSWPLATWRQRYLDHPLVGILARRIIWQFTTGEQQQSGIFLDGQLVGHNDAPLVLDETATTVALWHPIHSTTDETLAWREWLQRHEIRQPFKQAHREVYLLTDAERGTRVYSNRFAAHILKQHQYSALCGARGWKNKLRLMVDDDYPPTSRELPQWGLRAEFWVEGAGTEFGEDTNESGSYLYLTTDQVRFYPAGSGTLVAHASGGGYHAYSHQTAPEPVPLEEIPPLVLSEIMRDVDLFVGVASVGNDANWSDGGVQGQYRDYWQSYSFGELSATAQTRRQVLERLIPRLKIASRCSFSDRFLVVRGDLRTYKIHLGSSNILMEPNDQYLCIVPNRSAAAAGDKVFLPFEGDSTLSVILSKALLLAEDTKIKDETITRQIKP